MEENKVIQLNDGGKYLVDLSFRSGYAQGARDMLSGVGLGLTIGIIGTIGACVVHRIVKCVGKK